MDRVVLDLKTNQSGIADKLTFDIMKQRTLGDPKVMKGKKLAAFDLALRARPRKMRCRLERTISAASPA